MEPRSHSRSAKSTHSSTAPASNADRNKSQTTDAKLSSGVSAPASASGPRPASSSSRLRSSQRKGKRQVSSSFSPARVRGTNGSGSTVMEMSKITANSLASINHSLFTQAKLTSMQIRSRLLKEYLQAHSAGARMIENQWAEEYQTIWQSFLDASYTPQSREIKRLLGHTQLVELTCQQKLQHAHTVTYCALSGIEQLVQRITDAGTCIRNDTNVLAEKPDLFLGPTDAKELCQHAMRNGSAASATMHVRGNPRPEVCGLDVVLSDPHPLAFQISQADHDERERLSRLFNSVLDSIGADSEERSVGGSTSSMYGTIQAASALGTQSMTDCPLPMPHSRNEEDSARCTECSSPTPHSTRWQSRQDDLERVEAKRDDSSLGNLQPERTQYVRDLQSQLDALGVGFVQLMNRIQAQHQRYQHTIASQQVVLDSQATRLKLADDVLRNTVAQGQIEALSAVAAAKQLSLELRERMEVSERNMNAALQALIEQSAEVCFDKDVLKEYDSRTTEKENCLCAFMTRMERQVVEQAEVLRKAQDGVEEIWQLREQWLLQLSSGAASEAGAILREPQAAARNVTPLPPPYGAKLKECDRATLLAFLERLTMHCPKATTHVISALDEHEAFCARHPQEAAASREDLARTAAVVQLLQKLDEEGRLHCSAHHTNEALSVRLRRLVEQHDAYMDFNETYARALVRQADAERRQYAPDTVAFFDFRTPVPEQVSSVASRRVAPVRVQTNGEDHSGATSSSAAALYSAAELKTNLPALPKMPYLSIWTRKQQELRERQYAAGAMIGGASSSTVGAVVGYLERHPSCLAAPTAATRVAAPTADLFEATPSSTRSRLHTAISASALTCVSASTPPPPIPPRKGLASYVISTCGSTTENTEDSAATAWQQQPPKEEHTVTKEKRKPLMLFRGGDHQFIQREREVLVQED
ncbi:hypothetical protein Q4I30_003164 [Leishmania utingensis]|uniref:Uncharacterized protein n=1 Tax=Leishmania utingensis TaxID=653362 RepID=A0AAW3AMB8_9TRYP